MLKTFSSLVLVATALASFSAMADVEITIGQTKSLPYCGGSITVNNGGNDNQVNLVFEGVKNCTFLDIPNKKDQRVELNQKVSRTITTAGENSNGYKVAQLVLHSNGYNTYDKINVSFRVTGSTPTYNSLAAEISMFGTLKSRAVLAKFGGQSDDMVFARMHAICKAIGMNSAVSYKSKPAAYTGQVVLELKNGAWTDRAIKDASQAFVFSSLKCN